MSLGCWLRNGVELDHLRSGKCDTQHLGSEVHEHCRIVVLGADHGTEAVPIMADPIAHGVARHNCDGWRLVEGTSWEGARGAGATRSHASSLRPLGRAGAPLRLWAPERATSGGRGRALPVRSWCGNGWKGVRMSFGGRTDVVLKFCDSWNRGEIDFDELVDEDIVNHQPDVEPELGRDRFREAIAGVMAAVPASRWDVSDVLADRERVAIRITWSGTDLGAYFRGWTIPTPAKFAVEHVHIYRVAAGRLAEHLGGTGRLGNAAATWGRSPLAERRPMRGVLPQSNLRHRHLPGLGDGLDGIDESRTI
jgi:predicted ester cyclase